MLRGRGFVKSPDGDVGIGPSSTAYTGPHFSHNVHNTVDDNLQHLEWEFRP